MINIKCKAVFTLWGGTALNNTTLNVKILSPKQSESLKLDKICYMAVILCNIDTASKDNYYNRSCSDLTLSKICKTSRHGWITFYTIRFMAHLWTKEKYFFLSACRLGLFLWMASMRNYNKQTVSSQHLTLCLKRFYTYNYNVHTLKDSLNASQ